MGWKKKLRRAKELHRPSLKDWECDGLYAEFPSYVQSLEEKPVSEQQFRSYNISSEQEEQTKYNLPVSLDARTLTSEEFWSRYENSNTPCIIHNIPNGYDNAKFQGKEWPAMKKWSLEGLEKSGRLRERVFKCGEDDDGNSIKVRMKYFLRYLHRNRDDSPLYIFDSSFENDRHAKNMLQDYNVPTYFRNDLFRFISESRRPPYRWVLVGPQRSGSTIHIDPLATNAWNTLLHGKKRWVLFPPDVPKSIVKGRGLIYNDEDDETIHYFMTILPRIKRKAAMASSLSFRYNNKNQNHHVNPDDDDYRHFACYEFTQNAGETVFVPNGWWHAVLNLTHTVGVTQNFCSPRNFEKVWIKTRSSRKRMAWKWLCALDEHYPQLADRARELNERDHFKMKYDPVEIKKKREEAAKERRRKMQRTV